MKSPGFQLTRPEIYYGESTQDPVFVHTAREEFDYPSGDQNKYSTYSGTGGFPVGSLMMRTAAAISQGEPNITHRLGLDAIHFENPEQLADEFLKRGLIT